MAESSAAGPAVVTRAFAGVGRATLGRLTRLDLQGIAARLAALAEEHEDGPLLARAGGIVRWARLFARNFELTVYWLAAWAMAHVVLVLLGGIAYAHSGVPHRLAIPFDLLPGLMFLVSVVRLAVTTAQVRRVGFSTAAAPSGQPRLVNPPRPPLLLRLLEPTDLDLAVVMVVLVLVEFLAG
jgi:lysylphosphatidylglycerol synthetase-like protein (DUF2156 family)